jgi:hypothetical protein
MEQFSQQVRDVLHEMTDYHYQQFVSYQEQLEQERIRYRDLETDHHDALRTIQQLKDQIGSLKQENKDFMSVSRIVALSNENTKLHQTIELLEKTIKNINTEHQPPSPPPQTPHKVAPPVPEDADPTTETTVSQDDDDDGSRDTPPQDTTVYTKKKIKGTYYLVSSEDEIYELNEEHETPGQLVGRYVIKNDKRVIRWLPSSSHQAHS